MSKDDEERLRIRAGDEELYIAPASQSAARAAAVLPMEPSEDASRVLGALELSTSAIVDEDNREYLPNEKVSWVVTVQFAGEPRLKPEQVASLFDGKWREQFGSLQMYGRDADTCRWTFLISGDGPAAVTRLKFSWYYVDQFDEGPAADATLFERRFHEVNERLSVLGEITSAASLSSDLATKRAKDLARLKSNLDQYAVLFLKAPPRSWFEGKAIWDVMLCLGLQWGDMDCFHWENSARLVGDDYHFSVATSTWPGYFLPERIAAGQVQVEDLVFAYSIPRCAKPVEVFDAMVRAVAYCRARLGGEIRDEYGRCANLVELRSKVVDIERQLRDADFLPGGEGTLELF